MNTQLFKLSRSRTQSGFTLVELMIVVAIIGILASIAVPNYQKYQAKARTTEGKIYLAGVYTAQKSFIVEYSSYTACLSAAGFAPDGSNRYYGIGIADAATNTCGPAGNQTCINTGDAWTNGAPACTIATTESGWPATAKVATGGAVVAFADLTGNTLAQSAFTIVSRGKVHPSDNTIIDTWQINENKVIRHTTVGY